MLPDHDLSFGKSHKIQRQHPALAVEAVVPSESREAKKWGGLWLSTTITTTTPTLTAATTSTTTRPSSE